MCLLDNYVWHQGNPIRSGERWSLVIFYAVRPATQSRLLRVVARAAAEKRKQLAAAPGLEPAASSSPSSANRT